MFYGVLNIFDGRKKGGIFLEIRVLNKKDAVDFRKLRLTGLQTDPSAFATTYQGEIDLPLENFEMKTEATDTKFVIGGFDKDKLVCMATFIRLTGEKLKHKGMLVAMYCLEEYRGTGVAKDVVKFLVDKAKELEGLEIIILTVVTENIRAKSFYETFGFKNYGTEPKALFDGVKYYDEDLLYLEV